MKVRRTALLGLLAAVTFPSVALASPPAPVPVPVRVSLPGDASAASVRSDPAHWLVGVRPSPEAARIAAGFGATHVAGPTYEVARGNARAFAGALRARRLLVWAEPNARVSKAQVVIPSDPLSAQATWRDVVAGGVAPPLVGPASPLIALVDSGLDATHPEIATGSNITTTGTQPVTDLHGTATAIVAAAPLNGVGILGVWPGARATNFAVPQHRDPATGTEQLYCSDSTAQIAAAVAAGAAVISMSYGSLSLCIAEYVEVQRAVQKGAIPVAASGNENAQGDPLEYPAALPHVLTVGAVDGAGVAAPFSNRSPAVDLSAPGVGVLTGVPLAFDTDGTVDGYMALSGTSFATPMVAAAAAWVRDSRPDLTPDQVAQTLRLGARDVGRPGWSSDTGYGVLSVAGALAQPAPTDDPDEPNDDILFVDGRAFGKAAKRIFTGGRTAKLTARLDQYEDPSDVYRIRLSPRSRVRVSIKPSQGDPDLYVFAGKAQAITSKRVLAKSKKRGLKTDSVSVRNTSGKAMSAYVVAVIDSSVKTLNATYALTVKRAG